MLIIKFQTDVNIDNLQARKSKSKKHGCKIILFAAKKKKMFWIKFFINLVPVLQYVHGRINYYLRRVRPHGCRLCTVALEQEWRTTTDPRVTL